MANWTAKDMPDLTGKIVLDPSDDAKNGADAARLWQISQELTGVSYLN